MSPPCVITSTRAPGFAFAMRSSAPVARFATSSSSSQPSGWPPLASAAGPTFLDLVDREPGPVADVALREIGLDLHGCAERLGDDRSRVVCGGGCSSRPGRTDRVPWPPTPPGRCRGPTTVSRRGLATASPRSRSSARGGRRASVSSRLRLLVRRGGPPKHPNYRGLGGRAYVSSPLPARRRGAAQTMSRAPTSRRCSRLPATGTASTSPPCWPGRRCG